MVLSTFSQYLTIDTFHRFSYFLGTSKGELLRRCIELLFYSVILYMIFSEFEKNRKREYKYLIVGFFALFIRQAFMSLVLFSQVFSDYKFNRFGILLTFLDTYLETISLILIIAAFIFPAFKKRTFLFQKGILNSLLLVTIITSLAYLSFRAGIILPSSSQTLLQLLQILVLLTPFYILTRGDYQKIRYRTGILLAFLIYLLIPLPRIVSSLLLGNVDPRLIVAQHPLPFISMLLLMRAVYLTLVDKAFLRTKLKKSEEIIKKEKDLNKLKDYFISMVSHELRTPITSMKLYLTLFKKGKFGRLSQKQKKAVQTLHDENKRLGDLIDNLLILKKIETGKLNIEKSVFDLNDIIDELYITIAESKNIKVVKKIKKRFMVNGDKNKLKQVYINLMNNAIKFSDKKGKIEIKSGKKKKKWYLSIKDNGIGIPKSEIPKLFDKFYQVEDILTRKNQGVGLGLSIVKSIVELHQGKIEINSEPGKGTEFRVLIPE